MNDSGKIIAVQTTEKLIDFFVQTIEFEQLPGFSVRPALIGERAELRLEAQNQKLILPIRPILSVSRKLLKSDVDFDGSATLLLSPQIPEGLAADLRKQAINHADLNGRLFIRTPWLLLDRAPRLRRYRAPVFTPDLFALKTSRLVRALLSQRDRAWTQEELTAHTYLSRGLVSRILVQLTEEDYLIREGTGTRDAPARYRLREFDRLLDAWKSADRWSQRVNVQQYSVLAGDLAEVAASARDILRNKAGEDQGAFTQWFAAHLRHPYTTPPVVSVYVPSKALLDLPFGRKVDSGGNLWLVVPSDPGIFQETQLVKGYRLVSDIQIYLDLLQVSQRGPEQAEALRRWENFAR